MKKMILLCTLLVAGTTIQANELPQAREEMLQEVQARLAALDAPEDTHLARDVATGAAAIGASGAALVAFRRGDITVLRDAIETLRTEMPAQHSWFYPSWMPGAQGWANLCVLGIAVLGVAAHVHSKRARGRIAKDMHTFMDKDSSEGKIAALAVEVRALSDSVTGLDTDTQQVLTIIKSWNTNVTVEPLD